MRSVYKQRTRVLQFRERADAQSSEFALRLKLAEKKALDEYQRAIDAEELAAELEREVQVQTAAHEVQLRDADELREQVARLRVDAAEISRRLVEAQQLSLRLAQSRDAATAAAAVAADNTRAADEGEQQALVRLSTLLLCIDAYLCC